MALRFSLLMSVINEPLPENTVYSQNKRLAKTKVDCTVAVLGAGVAGSHTAYRLSSRYNENLCIFERENHVGGRTHDLNYDGNVPGAYSQEPISAQGAIRFYDGQQIVKELADELNISYYRYDYQTSLIKARGGWFNSTQEMCEKAFVNLTCADDENGLDAADQRWSNLIGVYKANTSKLHEFGDFLAYCRYVLGDEETDFLRDSFRFRGDFDDTSAFAYMNYFEQEWNLVKPIYYPHFGMAQFAKRMIKIATEDNSARLFLNQNVVRINELRNQSEGYTFQVDTSDYQVRVKRLVAAMDPHGWRNIKGNVAYYIKRKNQFKSIIGIPVVTIQCYWTSRWWEQSQIFGNQIDRAWTRQNCINFIEITSRHPEERDQNLTRAVYDDGTCVQTWINLIQRETQQNLIDEIVRGLQAIFTDVKIEPPRKVFTQIWPGAWHFIKGNSRLNNNQIVQWAKKPLIRYKQSQLSLIGESFYPSRSAWIDAALKSSLVALTSQFDYPSRCFPDDIASEGSFCSNNPH